MTPTGSQALKFTGWLDDFFGSYFRRRPVNATFIGMHAYDDHLPDLSEDGQLATLADAEDLLRRLRGLPAEALAAAQVLDRELAEGFLLIQQWESRSAHFGSGNPCAFTGEAIFGLVSLLLRPFAPIQQRLDMATVRLEAVPSFLDDGVHQIRSAPAAWIERARRECTGARLLLEAVAVEYPSLERSAHAARQSFARFDAHLQSSVEPADEYACGDEALDLLLRHAHFLASGADELERLALERIAEEEAAIETSGHGLPDGNSQFGNSPYLERFDTLWRAARDLAVQYDLVSFPEWPVRYVERPSWAREAAPYLYFLPYRSPAPHDDTPVVDYLVPPEADDSTIKLNHVVHHGSLGHHVQNWFAARAASKIGRIAAVDCASRIAMLCGGTMAEGWANYATDLVEDAGFLKNSLFPGAACMYLAGWDGLWRLRRELEARQRGAFSLRAFHDRILSFGSVPVSLIAASVRWG